MRDKGAVIAFLGGLAAVVGSFLVWATWTSALLSPIDQKPVPLIVHGTSLREGRAALVLGVLILAIAILGFMRKEVGHAAGLVLVGLGTVAGIVTVFALARLDDRVMSTFHIGQVPGAVTPIYRHTVSVGAGLLLCLGGALVSSVGGALLTRASERDRAAERTFLAGSIGSSIGASVIMVAGGALALVAVFLTWFTARPPLVEQVLDPLSTSAGRDLPVLRGWELSVGKVAFGLAVIGCILAIGFAVKRVRLAPVVVIVAGTGILGCAAFASGSAVSAFVSRVSTQMARDLGSSDPSQFRIQVRAMLDPSGVYLFTGMGRWLAGLGGTLLLVGALAGALGARSIGGREELPGVVA